MPFAPERFSNDRILWYGIIVLVFGGIAAWTAFKPQWHAEAIKASVQRGVAEAQPLRERVAAFAVQHGRFPVTAAELGLPRGRVYTGTGIAGVELASEGETAIHIEIRQVGVIEVDFHKLPVHESIPQIVYTPVLAGAQVTWTCGSTRLKPQFVPAGCG
jgi:hypothetical protein